ncbi:hypothetical protein KAJ61_06125 [Candidatus Parcubacteria bacterium]|nr:hypothetical protein [Candidatus Parcubacteria bacterium]
MKESLGIKNYYNIIEQKKENLGSLVSYYARKINNNFSSLYDKEIVADDASIKTRGLFTGKEGGPYKKEYVKKDDQYVKEKEEFFAEIIEYDKDNNAVDVPKRIKYLKETYGAKSREEMVAAAKREEQEDNPGFTLEKLLLVNLNRILGDKYAVIKSAAYDDYANDVDYLIVNYETGVVACGFDAVSDAKGGETYEKKMKIIQRKAKHEGSKIKYGLSIDTEAESGSKRVTLGKVEHVPTFCLSLSLGEIKNLLGNMNYQEGAEPNDTELKTFDILFQKLEDQAVDFKNNKKLNPIVREKLEGFDDFVSEAKDFRTERFG